VKGRGIDMKFAAVILNWNQAELTESCLAATRRATGLDVDYVVVDNGSDAPFRTTLPGVTVVRNSRNLGFTGGANVGLQHAFSAGADYVWLLNNDAEPLSGALDALAAMVVRNASIGLASSVIVDSNAWENKSYGLLHEAGEYNPISSPEDYERCCDGTPSRICLLGTALLVSRTLVERIGYFDDELFAYWEDIDISRRSASAGFNNVVVIDSYVRHASNGASLGKRPPYYYYYMTRNQLLIARKLHDPLRPTYWALRRFWQWYKSPSLSKMQRRAIRQGVLHGFAGISGRYLHQ
jgi:GT2 family glycosyltransferase